MENPKVYIVELARSFPCLQSRVSEDERLWDVEKLWNATGLSSGEHYAAAFVAAVWSGNDRRMPFNLIEAMGCWDSQCQRAFLAWASNPRWP